jgi:lipoprotein-anchoring transpeptidase ErfK/SrfK
VARRGAGVVAIAAGLALLGGAGVAIVAAARTGSTSHGNGAPATARAVSVRLGAPAAHGKVRYDAPLAVQVDGGTLVGVRVTGPRGAVAGTLSRGEWQSSGTLLPASSYTIVTSFRDDLRHLVQRSRRVTTTDAPHKVQSLISPGDGDVVGVGAPVIVTFDQPVAQAARLAVQLGMSVQTSPAVVGAWHWMSPTEAHWRPHSYWAAHTSVTVTSDLRGIRLGPSTWGQGRHVSHFQIGDRHTSVADAAAHTMTVSDGTHVVRVFKMSAGNAKYPTKSGVHIALEKQQVVTMDSQTVGIPRKSPDGYYEKVFWDVRISNGGAFVHAAPWSVGAQGNRNVSHGCVNLAPADAEWFFTFTQRGDVVNVVHSGVPPTLSDPGMSDWNLTWKEWVSQDS